ncbi:MAG: polysaccharide biosynthesis protein [Ruminococcus sp.]|nr:polysaccharide biosynthesis protein [Ruminococcus sp.]
MAKKFNAIENAKSDASATFLKGAAVLTVSMVIVKIFGFVDKILLSNLFSYFGDSYAAFGTGLYNNAYEIYIPIFTVATAGFPIAISRLISESISEKRYKDVKQIYKVSIPFFAVMGTLCFLIMFGGSFLYVQTIKSPYSLYAMLMLSPSILVGCFVSIYRGYFEGQRNMVPTAVSEIFEAGGKLVFGLLIAFLVLKIGKDQYETTGSVFGMTFENGGREEAYNTIMAFSVAGAIAGIVLGSLASLIYLIIRYKVGGDGIPKEYLEQSIDARSKKEIFITIVKTAIPIGLTALAMNIGTFFDSLIIQNVLHSLAQTNGQEIVDQYKAMGVDLSESLKQDTIHTTLWGCYGAATPLMQLVTAVTQVFGTSAMPNVTSAWTKGNKTELKTSIETVIRLTMMFALPASFGLVALANPIMDIVYVSNTQAVIGAQVLKVMGFAALVIACVTPICSMLQGIGKVRIPLYLFTVGIVIKVVSTFLFVRIPSINIQGGSVGSLVSHLFILITAIYLLVKHSKVMPDFVSTVIKPAIAAALSAAGAYFCYIFVSKYMHMILATMVSILLAGIIYITFLLILKTFTRNELKFLPKGEKIVTILEKYHLIR